MYEIKILDSIQKMSKITKVPENSSKILRMIKNVKKSSRLPLKAIKSRSNS
jgi:hypothetical protein